MFYQERQNRIFEIIEEQQRVEVNALSKTFNVSVDTIRRDLRQMEKEGLLQRTHGGAILPQKTGVSMGYETRKKMHSQEKTKIAKLASTYLNDHDTILMDGSTTTAAVIPHLKNLKHLTIFTNSITVAHELLQHLQSAKVFMIGGILHPQHESSFSIDCLSYIQKLYVDKVIVGSCSISVKRGLSATDIEDASIKKAMLNAGQKVIILADRSKFTRESMVQIAPIDPSYTIITDEPFSESILETLTPLIDQGLEIKVAE